MPKAKDFHLYHGIALTRLIHDLELPCKIHKLPGSNAAYIINESIGIFIKYSAKRLSPWRFTFLREHRNEVLDIKNKVRRMYIVLVCHHDGIATLNFEEFESIFDYEADAAGWISVERRKNEMYTVAGNKQELDFKIGDNIFPEKLFSQ